MQTLSSVHWTWPGYLPWNVLSVCVRDAPPEGRPASVILPHLKVWHKYKDLMWREHHSSNFLYLSILQQTKRKLDDANKRLEFLYDKLRDQMVSFLITRYSCIWHLFWRAQFVTVPGGDSHPVSLHKRACLLRSLGILIHFSFICDFRFLNWVLYDLIN